MVQINFAKREINCKIVYYGDSGVSLDIMERLPSLLPEDRRGELQAISIEGDRTFFIDFMSTRRVGGMATKFQLYSGHPQVYYNATRKLLLQGADGVLFVNNPHRGSHDQNLYMLDNLEENLREFGLELDEMPLVFQWCRSDHFAVDDPIPVEQLERDLNARGAPTFESDPAQGEGLLAPIHAVARLVLDKLQREYGLTANDPKTGKAGVPAPPPPPTPRASSPAAEEAWERDARAPLEAPPPERSFDVAGVPRRKGLLDRIKGWFGG